jgi:hypothetical protein
MGESKHFAVDSNVVTNNKTAKVIARPGNGFLVVQYEDGTIQVHRPYALQNEWSD